MSDDNIESDAQDVTRAERRRVYQAFITHVAQNTDVKIGAKKKASLGTAQRRVVEFSPLHDACNGTSRCCSKRSVALHARTRTCRFMILRKNVFLLALASSERHHAQAAKF